MIIINIEVKEALAMNEFVDILRINIKSFESILEKTKTEDYIKLVNEIILSGYKQKEIIVKKITESGIDLECEDLISKVSIMINESKICKVKGEYKLMLLGVDIINKTIKKTYEFLYSNKENKENYIEIIERIIQEQECHAQKIKKLLGKYY